MNEKNCTDCGYCKEFPEHSFCQCSDKGSHELTTYNEAKNCEYYDDDSWMK
ncbi:hypothetical protein G9F71_008560 [Clostridium sp. FP2]|uniref:hypothetical protein n=1 Tax=Clostridium sp. FP2 TaxID=2724481 RepID=UPI0013E96DEF|nr:hypothetical protein [Clostridium sp. FP2]MBZ9622904.1 hypothetical protein [Clostridium sp. FP2]